MPVRSETCPRNSQSGLEIMRHCPVPGIVCSSSSIRGCVLVRVLLKSRLSQWDTAHCDAMAAMCFLPVECSSGGRIDVLILHHICTIVISMSVDSLSSSLIYLVPVVSSYRLKRFWSHFPNPNVALRQAAHAIPISGYPRSTSPAKLCQKFSSK
jgi:hypothetical protein